MWSCMSNFGGHPWGFGTIIFLIILGLLVYAVIRAVSGRKDTRNHFNDRNDSLEILKIRLARGEIDVAEFERLKSYLQAQL